MVAADQLLANPYNWRIHPERQQKALAASLDGVGWVQDVIVNQRNGHVIDGHLRVALAISKGEQVPVKYVDLSDEEERLVLATLDPLAAMAATDRDMLEDILSGLRETELVQDDGALDTLLHQVAAETNVPYGEYIGKAPESQIDRAEELRELWQTECGQVWVIPSASVLGRSHRIMCGNSTSATDMARLMRSEKAGAVATDPPYLILGGGTSIAGKGIEAVIDRQFFRAWFKAFYECTVPHLMINSGMWLTIDWRGAVAIEEALIGTRYRLAALGVWDRGNLGMGYVLRRSYENFAVIVAEGFSREATDEPDVWRIKWGPGYRQSGHSAEKPVELIVRALRLLGGDIVLDPFLGSGTTIVAAEQIGRICYGMEIEPKYVAVTLQRLADMGLEPEMGSDGGAS